MRELESRYPNEIAVVGVHSGKFIAERVTERIRDASLRLGATHPVVNDRQFRTWRAYAVSAWPTLAAIDPRGHVVGMHAGEFDVEQLVPFVERVLSDARADGSLQPRRQHPQPDAPTNGPGTLRYPGKVAVAGEMLAIADSGNHRVVIAQLDAGGARARITRVIGGTRGLRDGTDPQFDEPQGLALDDGALYVCDARNHALRAIDVRSGFTRTVAGTGAQRRYGDHADSRALSSPWDVAVHRGGTETRLLVAMAGTHQLWSVRPTGEDLRRVAGSGAEELHDGAAAQAALAQPMGIAIHGDLAWFADAESSAIRSLSLDAAAKVRTAVGTGLFDFGDRDGIGDEALLQHPQGVALADDGRVLVADSYNDSLRWLDPRTRQITTWVRGLAEPGGIALTTGRVYVADTNAHRIAVVDRQTAAVTSLELVE